MNLSKFKCIAISTLLVFAMQTNQVNANSSWTQTDWSGGDGQGTWESDDEFSSETGEGLYMDEGDLKMKANADVVVGQDGFERNQDNQAYPMNNSLYTPEEVFSDGTRFFVADSSNNRVLIYNQIPTTNNASADVVIGQENFISHVGNAGGIGANTLYGPKSVFSDGTKLFIVDQHNSRVLIYNTIPTENNASADLVIGQVDFTSGSYNQGGDVGANTLNRPNFVYLHGTRLFVAEDGNNRVLIFNTVPTENNAFADVVIGQADFNSGEADQGGSLGANTLDWPCAIYSDGTSLLVVDQDNHRVLIYNTIPLVNNVSADVVIGQSSFSSGGSSVAVNRMHYPESIYSDGTRLLIADGYNHRVLIYDTIPTTSGASADVVIGQEDFTSGSINQGGNPAANTLNRPSSIYYDGTRLFIAGRYNNRVLIYDMIPVVNNASADVVIGQVDFTESTSNQGEKLSATSQKYPTASFTDGQYLAISEKGNHRVLIYNTIPTTNNAAADVVIGQADFENNTANQGSGADGGTMNWPSSVHIYEGKLFVSDSANHRVLVYNSMPTENGAEADVVIGQADFTGRSKNQGGDPAANTLYWPASVHVKDGRLFVADVNNRVLIYNTIPTTNNASADIVIGQDDFTGGDVNRGGDPAANTLNWPCAFAFHGDKFIVSGQDNSRVLIFNTIPTSSSASADVVIGQQDFTGGSSNQGGDVGANTLSYPSSVYVVDGRLFIMDRSNNRVLVYNDIPETNNANADVVIGQKDLESRDWNSAKSYTMLNPYGGFVNEDMLITSEYYNNRTTIFNLTPSQSSLTSSTYKLTKDQDFGPVTWEAETPEYTSIEVEVKTDKNPTWTKINNNDEYVGRGKELQYRVTLKNTDGISTPTFKEITFGQKLAEESKLDSEITIEGVKEGQEIKKNETIKTKKHKPTLKGQSDILKNGEIKIYKNKTKIKTIKIDSNGKWSDEIKLKHNKTYNLKIKYIDQYGGILKTEKFKLKVDSEDPVITDFPPNKVYKRVNQEIYWTATDNEKVKKYKVTFNGRNHKTKDSTFTIPHDTPKGLHTFTLKVYDSAGNTTKKGGLVRVW